MINMNNKENNKESRSLYLNIVVSYSERKHGSKIWDDEKERKQNKREKKQNLPGSSMFIVECCGKHAILFNNSLQKKWEQPTCTSLRHYRQETS